jgi:hypothetical protein
MPAFPILGGRLFCIWRRRQKRGPREESRGPRGFLKSGVESTVSWGTLIEFARSVHLGSVTKLGEGTGKTGRACVAAPKSNRGRAVNHLNQVPALRLLSGLIANRVI